MSKPFEKIIKAFFDSSLLLNRDKEGINSKIINLLNKHGCNVVQTVMGTDLSYIGDYSEKAASNIFLSKLKDVRDSEIVVCEISDFTMLLSFEIFEALKLRKPVLALFMPDTFDKSEVPLLSSVSDYLEIAEYNDTNLEEIILKFVTSARKKLPDSRFTVRLSQEMGEYMEYLKPKLNASSKNEVIIKLLEDFKSQDDEFKNQF